MKYFILNVIFLLLFAGYTLAQDHVLTGTVYEKTDKKKIPLPGVNVYWSGTQEGTVTDETGKFTIQRKPENNFLVVSFVGFKNDTIAVAHDHKPVEVVLSSVKELDEVVVSEKHQSSFISQISPMQVQHVTGDELRKAACCNLSESFETNASVDVSYSDAVTGAKRIELLGLHGKYSQMMTENIPNLRGLATPYGLGYIPGSWLESIQISKGAASVVNGYESMTGQINTEYKKPDNSEKLYLNAYANHIGKVEGNFNSALKINEKWSTMLLGHAENLQNRIDHNNDSFLDAPLITQYNFMNRWKYVGEHYMGQVGFQVLDEQRSGGQVDFRKSDDEGTPSHYGIGIDTRRYQVWGKTGYVFENFDETSIGFINSYTWHQQKSFFGMNDYNGTEKSFYSNLILQSQMGSHRHRYSTGASFNYDDYRQSLNDSAFNRVERVPGVFFQYTYTNEHNLTALAGIRADFHNIWGTFYTPRFHVKYNVATHTVLRASAGKGYRTANIIAENTYLLATSAQLHIANDIRQEEAWNYGLNLTQTVDIKDRELNISLDFYRTDFENQVVIDRDQDFQQIFIYNLNGESFSNSYQVEAVYELIPRLDVLAAFRYSDVRMTYNGELRREPLVNRYKGLLNLSYKTNLEKWQFDFTTQLNGDARLPDTKSNPMEYRRPENSPVYTIINAQVTKYFRKWNVYIGAENLTDFTQDNPVIASDDPFGEYFDSSLVWGPIMGRKIYAGLRFQID